MATHDPQPDTLLELKNVSVAYGGVKALDGVDVYFKEGEIVALMGPNGAGKSTILKAAFGLAPLHLESHTKGDTHTHEHRTHGGVLWRGHKVDPVPHQMVSRGMTLVPQGKRVFARLTVLENLEVGGFSLRDKNLLKERIEEVLTLFPALKAKLKEKAGRLSGGQQQMVAIARGLITAPALLLLDEPSLGLAPKVVKEVFEKIKEINQKRGMAIVIVEHNLKSLLPIVDRAYVLDKGKVVAEGKGQDIVESGIFKKVFLGALE